MKVDPSLVRHHLYYSGSDPIYIEDTDLTELPVQKDLLKSGGDDLLFKKSLKFIL